MLRHFLKILSISIYFLDQTSARGHEKENLVVLDPIIVEGFDDSSYGSDSSSTATRMEVPHKALPVPVNVLSYHLLDEQQVIDPSEAVGNISSTTSNIGATGHANQITIRGFNTFTYVDGFRVGNSNSTGLGGISLPIDAAVIDRIEVIKGPSTTLFGRGLPGGVINYITKKPEPVFGGSLDALVGSFDQYRGTIDITGPFDSSNALAYRFTATAENNDSYRDQVENNNISYYPSFSWRISETSELLIKGEFSQSMVTPDRGVLFLPNQQADGSLRPTLAPISTDSYFYGTDENEWNIEQTGINANFSTQISNTWLSRLTIGARLYKQEGTEIRGDFLDDSQNQLIRVRDETDRKRKDYLLQFDNIFDFEHSLDLFAGTEVSHKLLIGADWQYNWFRTQSDFVGVDELDTTTGATQSTTITGGSTIPVSTISQATNFLLKSTDVGFALQDLIAVGEKWHFLVGLRYDYAELDLDLAPFPIESTIDRSEWTARTGVIYQATEPIAIFANYGESFRPTLIASPVQSAFDAQLSEQIEVGLKLQLIEGRLQINTALFRIENDNVVTAVGRDTLGNIIPGTLTQEVNGYEIDLTMKVNDNISLLANYAYLDTEVSGNALADGNQIAGVPRHSCGAWASYHFNGHGNDGLSTSIGINYKGSVYSSEENELKLPSALLLNAGLAYRAGQWEAKLNLYNMTDHDYYVANNNVVIGDPTAPIYAMPAAPFEIRFSISRQF